MNLCIKSSKNVELPSENSVNLFIDSETSTLKGKMVDSSILEFSKTIEVQPDYSNLGITISSSDVKSGKYFIDSTGTLQEGSLNESSITMNTNEIIVSDGFINETQTIQVGTLYSGSNELTPGTEDQTLNPNTFINENIIIKGDANLLAENIKKDVTIFGVTGTYEVGGDTVNYELQVANATNASANGKYYRMETAPEGTCALFDTTTYPVFTNNVCYIVKQGGPAQLWRIVTDITADPYMVIPVDTANNGYAANVPYNEDGTSLTWTNGAIVTKL